MDFGNALSVQYRVVQDTEYDGQPARVVSGAHTFATNIEDMWDAVTNAELIPGWFLPIPGDLKLGGRYLLDGNAGGEITRCDPPTTLDVTWEYAENVSWVTVQLEPDGDGTRLTLKHTMLKDEASEKHWKQFGPGATGVGWDLGFVGLGLHLESGEAVVQEESHAWMASEAGKSFIRESAKAWGESHIRSGESADVANAMAEQTAKAYTGE
jgi:uncharacterized protein YndB with AHSA1/START domain